ncbi:MAG: hypothetical protein JNL70_14480 [Saprospiraceae bacterium]|nr:hypothetical protein [Saprospiraceae bacterium]
MSKTSLRYTTVLPRFLDIINILEAIELGKWNPVNPNLSILSLKERHARAQTIVDNYERIFEIDKIKTTEREAAYASLNTLVQRIYAAAISCQMSPPTLEQIKIYKDLIDGNNAAQVAAERKREEKKAKEALEKAALEKAATRSIEAETNSDESDNESTETKKRSVSKQAYELRYDNFKRLINLLTVAETYKTHLPDLTLDALNLFLDKLAAANKATNDADKAWADAVAARNACLRGAEDSVYATVRDIKTELVVIETKNGANYKKVVGLPISPLRK